MGKRKYSFYGVACGRQVGVYNTWDECDAQVKGFAGNSFQGFHTYEEAARFAFGSSQPVLLSNTSSGAIEEAHDIGTSVSKQGAKEELSGNGDGAAWLDAPPLAAVEPAAKDLSVAWKMMRSMGHVDGSGLGREGQGIASPVRATGRAARVLHGLGFGSSDAAAEDAAAEGVAAEDDATELSAEQQNALGLALGGSNVFLTGGPGCGKSTTLKRIIRELKRKHGDASVLIIAPTGVAALNVGGQTMHSRPGPGQAGVTTKMFGNMWGSKEHWKKVRTVVLDEVSMADAEFLDYYIAQERDLVPNPRPSPTRVLKGRAYESCSRRLRRFRATSAPMGSS